MMSLEHLSFQIQNSYKLQVGHSVFLEQLRYHQVDLKKGTRPQPHVPPPGATCAKELSPRQFKSEVQHS